MIKALYGNLRITCKSDAIVFPLKILYIIFTIPFLIIGLLLCIRSLGVLGNPLNEKFSKTKKIVLHLEVIFVSYFGWVLIIQGIKCLMGK